ncbi:RTC domain-containing 1 [Collybia nuda]|uniref:RNA 3'-terminal-phosphate cyclase (ATP) n=1 Tax=Collybia nuda TaxID=64659 RepID=A0A9P6CFV6_9AGAR|nr:RTC domain-containing 1 [Collybia nuda]
MAAAHLANVLIDGSMLEGGGQILRNSVSLSALLSKSVSINRIRNGRKPPGLKNQHQTGLELAAEISSAHLTGATNGSNEINFVPGRICLPGHYIADSVTAGSTMLLLQIALPLLLFSVSPMPPSTLTLFGGTNAIQAPQIDYTLYVFLPFMRRHFGLEGVNLDIKKRGYFPKGGGEVRVTVKPFYEAGEGTRRLHGMRLLVRGGVKSVCGIAHLGKLPSSVGREMVEGARMKLKDFGSSKAGVEIAEIPVKIEYRRDENKNTIGAGSGIVLWAELEGGGMIGGSAVGRKGLDPAVVGTQAAEELIKGLQAGGCVDEWLQDQIIIYMALAHGKSELRCGKGGLTLHTQTAIWVTGQFTDAKFAIEEEPSGHTIIRCTGIGYTANLLVSKSEQRRLPANNGLN